jgi:hypothetical protein
MAGTTALVVVHGIGAQNSGEALGKLIRGLRTIDPNFNPADGRDGLAATLGGQPVRLYEVYWADLLKGEMTRGAFQMNELQSLSWFPYFNIRRGNYRPGSYSLLKLAWWCVALPIVNFFVLFAYYGAGFFAQVFAGSIGKRDRPAGQSDISRVAQKVVGHGTTLTSIDRVLDEYAGDVFSYVNSAGHAFYREKGEPPVPSEVQEAFPRIVQRFYEQLLNAHAHGCDSIQIVAHSLGTVVMYHALSGFGFDPRRPDADAIRAAKSKVSRLYTIGSPLEKIRFFWPRIAPVRGSSSEMNLRWDNFVSFFDPVSGMLRGFEDWGRVANHRLLGGGFIQGHVIYEHSTVFLDALIEGLCGRRIPFARSLNERLRDFFVLLGETLFAPTALAVALAVGAGLFVLVAVLLPFLVSLIARVFVPEETWVPVIDGASRVLVGLLVLTFLIAPALRARRVHSLYWAAAATEAMSRQQV